MDFTAASTAQLTGISIRSVITIYLKIRQQIVQSFELESPLRGSVEVNDSFFDAQCVRCKRGRGAYGKTIVFGVLKRQGKGYKEIVPDCSKAILQVIIRGHVSARYRHPFTKDGVAMMDWSISDLINISRFTMGTSNLPGVSGILVGSNLSEVLQKGVRQNSIACLTIPSICI